MFCNQHSWWQKQWVKHVWFAWLFPLEKRALFSLRTNRFLTIAWQYQGLYLDLTKWEYAVFQWATVLANSIERSHGGSRLCWFDEDSRDHRSETTASARIGHHSDSHGRSEEILPCFITCRLFFIRRNDTWPCRRCSRQIREWCD